MKCEYLEIGIFHFLRTFFSFSLLCNVAFTEWKQYCEILRKYNSCLFKFLNCLFTETVQIYVVIKSLFCYTLQTNRTCKFIFLMEVVTILSRMKVYLPYLVLIIGNIYYTFQNNEFKEHFKLV